MSGELMFRVGLLLISAAAAGAVNSVAGGGTLITFPTLIWLGLGSIDANATSTVGILPGAFASAWGYRRELAEVRPWFRWVLPPSFLGGVLGAFVLTRTPSEVFDTLVPFLVFGATLLFIGNERIQRRFRPINRSGTKTPKAPPRWRVVLVAQFLIAFYGGYFGAGMGIMMLGVLGMLHMGGIHKMNGLKSLAGAAINGLASGLFIVRGLVHWPEALTMLIGSILGGYLAAGLARELGEGTVRAIVIVIGLTAAIALGFQRFVSY